MTGAIIPRTIAHWLICYWTNIIKSTSQLIETDSQSIDLSFVHSYKKNDSFFLNIDAVHWLDRIVNRLNDMQWTASDFDDGHEKLKIYYTNFNLPEHLKSCSCNSAKLWPFSWLGEWHRVYGARRGELRKYRDNHDKWQSHVNGLSDKRNARIRGIPLKISRGNAVILLLFKVLWMKVIKIRMKFKN